MELVDSICRAGMDTNTIMPILLSKTKCSGQLRWSQVLENTARGKHLLVITPIVYNINITSVTHVCVLNININYFVTMETQLHPGNKALIKSSLTAYFAFCCHKIAIKFRDQSIASGSQIITLGENAALATAAEDRATK